MNKQISAQIKSVDNRTVVFRASDQTPDRDGDIILANGWELDNFIKTGSILYGHNPSRFPVAGVKDAQITGEELLVTAVFPEEGKSPDSDVAYNLIKSDVLKGVSVGFRALEHERNEETGGRIFTKTELLELSLTPVPANPNAMAIIKEYDEYNAAKYLSLNTLLDKVEEIEKKLETLKHLGLTDSENLEEDSEEGIRLQVKEFYNFLLETMKNKI